MTAYALTLENQPRWIPGETVTVSAVATIGTGVVTADTWTATNMLPAQKVQIVGGKFFGQEFDTNASPTATVIIGDGTDTDFYLKSKTAGGAAAVFDVNFDGDGIGGDGTAAGRDVVVTLGGTVATAASSGEIRVEVTYVCHDGARIS